ncbi:uncharacterized protein LOC111080331 [Drosophila obscura]|uniref:uncharacterized protein LOC111080331 n=1 Tax=Drosophila obscura TaxID=7282 RepID=UPI000BA16706|nr:uncharacterized protein LOC111080331 [Drosophila obscura]
MWNTWTLFPEEKLQYLRFCFSNAALNSRNIKEVLGLKKVDSPSASRVFGCSQLQTLGSAEEISGFMIIHMMLQKLDLKTKTKWEETESSAKISKSGKFSDFLEKRYQEMGNVLYAIATKLQPI